MAEYFADFYEQVSNKSPFKRLKNRLLQTWWDNSPDQAKGKEKCFVVP